MATNHSLYPDVLRNAVTYQLEHHKEAQAALVAVHLIRLPAPPMIRYRYPLNVMPAVGTRAHHNQDGADHVHSNIIHSPIRVAEKAQNHTVIVLIRVAKDVRVHL